jgi:hypothetical protein
MAGAILATVWLRARTMRHWAGGIPVEFRWLIKPLTDELPRRLMLDMLNDTRIAVRREAESSRSQEQN